MRKSLPQVHSVSNQYGKKKEKKSKSALVHGIVQMLPSVFCTSGV